LNIYHQGQLIFKGKKGKIADMFKYFFTYIDQIPQEQRNELFSIQHLLSLAMVVCLWLIIILIIKNKSIEEKWKALRVISLMLPFLELAQIVWYIYVGKFSWGYTLPVHLCSLMSILLPLMVYTKNRLLQEYSYAVGLAPAFMTLLTPDVYYYPSLSFIYIQTMLVHGIICLIPLIMVFCMGFKPDIRRLPRVIALLFGLVLIILPINIITEGNYFFLRYPAVGSPMETFEKLVGSPGYLVLTFLLGCVLWLILYIPFILFKLYAVKKVNAPFTTCSEISSKEKKEPILSK